MANSQDPGPRRDFLQDSDYFMAVALLAEQISSNKGKKGGACIVKDNDVVAIGYNQIINCSGDKQFCEYYAAVDAIMNCSDAKDCTLYVTAYPCNESMKLIIQAGIKTVFYLRKDIVECNKANASAKMFLEAKVECKMYPFLREDLTIEFKKDNEENMTEPSGNKMEESKQRDIFMALALLTAKRSRDPNTQVGVCFVKDSKAIAFGYNQMPKREDDKYTWVRGVESEDKDNKHLYVCHAELNAIVKGPDVKGCTVYVTLFPCHECAKLLIKAGSSKVVYLSNKYAERKNVQASKKMLEENGITILPFSNDEDPEEKTIVFKDLV